MDTIKTIDRKIKRLQEKREALFAEETAPLPAHHPLYGRCLKRKDICTSCKGWGRHFSVFQSSPPIMCFCEGSGLQADQYKGAAKSMQARLYAGAPR